MSYPSSGLETLKKMTDPSYSSSAVKLAINRPHRGCGPIASTLRRAVRLMDQKVAVAVKSALIVIEKSLREILQDSQVGEGSKNWVLKVRHSDIPDSARSGLAAKPEEMLDEIQALQAIFEIGKRGESVRAHLISNLTQIWLMLSELSPDKLRGYGQLTAEESTLLASHVNTMNQVRETMEKLLSS